jgi:hypothetical protein
MFLYMANSDRSVQERNRSTGLNFFPVASGANRNPAPLPIENSAIPEVPPNQNPSHAMHAAIRTYAELQQHIRDALREQHPEWVEPDGDSPICQSYEQRFAELLALFARSETRSAQTQNG